MNESSLLSSATMRGTAGGFPEVGGPGTFGDLKATLEVTLGGVPPVLAFLMVASVESGVLGDA